MLSRSVGLVAACAASASAFLLPPNVNSAVNALEAAHKEVNLKRFVLCSSASAAVSCYRGERNEVTSESWNMPLPAYPAMTSAARNSRTWSGSA